VHLVDDLRPDGDLNWTRAQDFEVQLRWRNSLEVLGIGEEGERLFEGLWNPPFSFESLQMAHPGAAPLADLADRTLRHPKTWIDRAFRAFCPINDTA
jgi:hypothetical protein